MKQSFLNVKKVFNLVVTITVLSVAMVSCEKDNHYGKNPPPPADPKSTVVKGSGDISAQLVEFRALLDEPLNSRRIGDTAISIR